jgi:N-acetylglucosaminyldiphosphoundecaprenol N-acetyl-beta-D-mannosaminyltransferase
MKTDRVNVLNVDFISTTKSSLVNILKDRIDKEQQTFIVTANPEIVMHAYKDEAYRSIVNQADYVIADGIGVVIASRLLGNPLPERIAGYDLLLELLKLGNKKKWSVYFLGAKKNVIEKAVENIKADYPGLNVTGWHDGYFDWNSNNIAEEISKYKPDLVFVALGFPKQEVWISENLPKFQKGLFMGVGGSFDVIAGEVKRAPLIWQKMNLEWLYRLLKQPSRWKRMLVLPLFMLKIVKAKLSLRK